MEFLTAEDASAALSFDGSSISGSVLKIRRPKDFVEVAVRVELSFHSHNCHNCLKYDLLLVSWLNF